MPSASMNRLMDNARVRLPGALDTTILAELFEVTKEFCSWTSVWQEQFNTDVLYSTLSPLEFPDEFTYPLFPTTGVRVERLIGTIDPRNAPIRVSLVQPNSIFLERSPSEDGEYRTLAVLTVTDPVTRTGEPMAPDWLVEKFNTVLLDGVLARMMSQTAKPYTNPAVAALHYGMFRKGMVQARVDAMRGYVYGRQAWTFPRDFAAKIRGR